MNSSATYRLLPTYAAPTPTYCIWLFSMLAACGGDCSKPLSIPETLVIGLTIPTFSASRVQRTAMPLLRTEWQMFGVPPPPRPQPPPAMCAAHWRALLTRFECTASGGKPCDARKLLMPATMAPSAPLCGATLAALGASGLGGGGGGGGGGGRGGGMVRGRVSGNGGGEGVCAAGAWAGGGVGASRGGG